MRSASDERPSRPRNERTRLPLGVRAIDRAFKASKGLSVEHMDHRALHRAQTAVIPDRGVGGLLAGAFLGRARPDVEITTSSYTAEHGEVPLRIYRPRRPGTRRPLIVNFHGGGFALGSSRQCDWSCSIVASELDAVVVSVDYRLAPTHRFPAAVDDCYDGLLWAVDHAGELGADGTGVGVMGDSAGGNLAAVVTIRARDECGPGIAHQALIYPAVDMTDHLRETASYLANTRGIVLTNSDLEIFRGHYVDAADDEVDAGDWRLSPLHAPDLSSLPPAVVVVAGQDPLHDTGVEYAEALAVAGVHVTVEDFHVMPHGFVGFPYFARGARPAMDAVVASQRAALR